MTRCGRLEPSGDHEATFSIVIPTFNRLSTLRRAIDSALSQTVPIEIIVVDDASSDDTCLYVKSLIANPSSNACPHRMVYQRLEVNGGHSAAMNVGTRLAQGGWIKPLDDDDYLAPNCIEEMAQVISLHEAAVICCCQAAQVDADGVRLERRPTGGTGPTYFIPQEDIHYGMLLDLVPLGTPVQVAFRRDVALQCGGWDSSFDTNCDEVDFWIRLARFGDAIFINRCLAYRTVWSGSHNLRFPRQTRLETNYLMKTKILGLVTARHKSHVPKLRDIRAYMNLHWAAVSLKDRAIGDTVLMACKGMYSMTAWRLLLRASRFRRQTWNDPSIRRITLTVPPEDRGTS